METYLEVIKQSLIFFPFVAMLITLPYVIYNYRKYGSVLSLRILIVYSFVLYMMCVYFLVILPLPSVEAVRQMTGPRVQLVPFMFAADIQKDFDAVYQVLFNVLMTVPFGIYMRYYFRCSFKKTLLLSFLLSLFFELTQLSGLYFIYPRSYRLFDVDDLMANTLGGVLGYAVWQPFRRLVPSRKKLDENSFARGKRISVSRRLLAFFVDMICLNIAQGALKLILVLLHADRLWELLPGAEAFPLSQVIFYLTALLYFAGIPTVWNGQTPGMRFMKMRVADVGEGSLRWYQPMLRYGILWLFGVGIPWIWSAVVRYGQQQEWISPALASVWQGILWGLYTAGVVTVLMLIALRKRVFYEAWSKTRLVSTITEM